VALWFGVPAGQGDRVKVAADLSVPGTRRSSPSAMPPLSPANGRALPGLAPVAKQQGRYVGEVVARLVRREPAIPPFRYHDQGAPATIGRHSAIADLGWIRLTGWVAWIPWGIVHIFFLIGFNWVWAWLTYGRGARLITGDTTPLAAAAKSAARAMPGKSHPRLHSTRNAAQSMGLSDRDA